MHKNKPTKKPLLFCRRKLLFESSKSRKIFPAGNAGNCRWERRHAHGVCRPGRDTAVRRKKDLIYFVRGCCLCVLIRGLQNLETPCKGFNCCGAKMSLRWADSRFAKPRHSLRKGRFSCFSLVRKERGVHQRFANLWTPGSIQSSAGSDFAEISGGSCRNRFCPQNTGVKALNRCERVTVVQTQDCYFSKMDCCTASLQWVFADKICSCSLALVRYEIEIFVC